MILLDKHGTSPDRLFSFLVRDFFSMFFVLNMFYLAALLYVSALCTSLFFSKTGRYSCFAGQKRFSIYLFCMGLTADFFSIAGRYYFAFPLMPMYQIPFFLPFFIGILSIKIIWQEDKRALGMVSAVYFLSVTAVLFSNNFYLPFLKSGTIFSHILFLSGVVAKACLVIAGIHSIYDIFIITAMRPIWIYPFFVFYDRNSVVRH